MAYENSFIIIEQRMTHSCYKDDEDFENYHVRKLISLVLCFGKYSWQNRKNHYFLAMGHRKYEEICSCQQKVRNCLWLTLTGHSARTNPADTTTTVVR